MKTILFTICVLMSIHAAISIERHVFYDNLETCFKDITSNNKELQFFKFNFSIALQPTFSTSFNFYPNIRNNLFNALVDSFICAFKKAGLINQEGTMLKTIPEQYCKEVLTKPENIIKCEIIAAYCTDFACRGVKCTSEEVKKEMQCKLKNGLLDVLEFFY